MNKHQGFKKQLINLVLVVGCLLIPYNAIATVIQFDLDMEFSGATDPEGDTPWLTIIIDDGDTTGSVTVSIIAQNLVGTEYVNSVYLNLDPNLDRTGLSIEQNSGAAAVISTATDSYKADGVGGLFDLLIDFPQAQNDRFSIGEVAVFTITLEGITADSFSFYSTPDNALYGYLSAAHIGGIGEEGEDSGWIATTTAPVPEPGTLLLIGSGLIGLAGFRKIIARPN